MSEEEPVAEKTINTVTQEDVEAAKDAKKEMNKILEELRQKMSEIDELTHEIDEKRNVVNTSSPKKTKKLLEELKVPPLEMLK